MLTKKDEKLISSLSYSITTVKTFFLHPIVQYASVVKYAPRSVNKGKNKTLHAIAKAERVLERGTATKMWCTDLQSRCTAEL